MKRVVITGIGAVTPLSGNFHSAWSLMEKGISGVGRIKRFDVQDLPWKMAGEVKDFEPAEYLTKKEVIRLDPFVQYALSASIMAVEDAGLVKMTNRLNPPITDHPSLYSAGVIIGSSRGGITTIEKQMKKIYESRVEHHSSRISPYLMPSTTISMAASYVAQKLGIKGNCLGISNACASGANAVGEAFRLIRHGYSSIMLAGGSDAPLCRLCLVGYGMSGALSKTNEPNCSRPFDRKRDGFILSEGACILVLEEYESAIRRGARIYAEIIGYGNTTDAFHITRPDIEGELMAMQMAIKDANISSADIDYINAHGTSTLIGDSIEAEAIKGLFKEKGDVPVSAIKSITGHMLGASGAFEIACTAMTIMEGIIPATINVTEIDRQCDINLITERKKMDVNIAISNSFGFGGVNAVLILKRFNR